VRHRALTGAQSTCFVHSKSNVETKGVIKECCIHDPLGCVGEFTHVATKEDGDICFQHTDDCSFHSLAGIKMGVKKLGSWGTYDHVNVYVLNTTAVIDVSKAIDGEQAHVVVTWIIDEADAVLDATLDAKSKCNSSREGDRANIVFVKFQWGLSFAMVFIILVGEGPHESFVRFGRRAKRQNKHSIYFFNHFGLEPLQFLRFFEAFIIGQLATGIYIIG
jgi:hypothetical protein